MGSFDFGEMAKQAPKGFEPVPAGPYEVEVTGTEVKQFNTGSQGVQLELTISAGPQKGKKLKFVNIVFKADNPGVFFGQLRAFGIGPEFFKEYGKIDDDDDEAITEVLEDVADELEGKSAIAPVTQKTFEGRVNNQVGFFKPLSEGTGGRKRRTRSGTPDVEPDESEDESEDEGEPVEQTRTRRPRKAESESEDEGPSEERPRRSRTGRSRRNSAEPGLPPGL